MPITIARRLKIARLQADLTQVQVAELVGLERNTISRYEAALRSPSALNLKRLARAYGKTLDWLCNEEDPSGYQEEPHPNEEPTPKEDPTQAILAADDSELVQICQRRRQIGPLGAVMVYHLGVMSYRLCPHQVFKAMVTPGDCGRRPEQEEAGGYRCG